jgi:CRISPR-associated protein Csb2
MYLVITIRFLSDRYHGRTDNGRAPEWPPSPLRLYQAILAGAAGRWHDSPIRNREVAAFEWFQTLGEPAGIVAPAFHHGRPLLKYVRENLSDIDPEKRDAKFSRPTLFCSEPKVIYYWPFDPSQERAAGIIADCARRCRALGWGVDLAIGGGAIMSTEPNIESGEKWLPMRNIEDGVPLRVPQPPTTGGHGGTLSALRNRFIASLKRIADDGRNPVPPLSPDRDFRTVAYRRAGDPPPRRFAAFSLRHPTEDRAAVFAMIRANHVAAMTRNAMARIAEHQGREIGWIDRYIHGHRQENEPSLPRFSYLPLPSIERRGEQSFVLGAIRRVCIAELCDSVESHLSWVRQMLPGQFLTDDKTTDRRAMLAPLAAGNWVLQRYIGYAETWATVTPVVLPGCDTRARKRSGGRTGSSGRREGRFTKAEKLFFKALCHAGYGPEALEELDFRNVSFWPGGELALRFHLPDYLKRGYWSVYNMRIRFKHAVKGPISLGAGRHCGLGIFAALSD